MKKISIELEKKLSTIYKKEIDIDEVRANFFNLKLELFKDCEFYAEIPAYESKDRKVHKLKIQYLSKSDNYKLVEVTSREVTLNEYLERLSTLKKNALQKMKNHVFWLEAKKAKEQYTIYIDCEYYMHELTKHRCEQLMRDLIHSKKLI